MLLVNTSVTGVLAGEVNLLSKQPELRVNTSEQMLANQENRNKDEDDKRENSRGRDEDNDDDDDDYNDDKNDD
jgi:hydroxymethylglutaryl-CoA reductase